MRPEPVTSEGYQRQPAQYKVTPSGRPVLWCGLRRPDARFTAEQEQAMVVRGLDPATAPSMCVRRQQPNADTWTPIGQVPPEYRFDCPVIGPGKGKHEGKVLVLAPSGVATHVWPDGWAHRPRGPKRLGWY